MGENQSFKQLNSAVTTLSSAYDRLQKALQSLRTNACNAAMDGRDQAIEIDVLGNTTRYGFGNYLKKLLKTTQAIALDDFLKCKSQASEAKYLMNEKLLSQVEDKNVEKAINDMRNMAKVLKTGEEGKKPSDDTSIQDISEIEAASTIVQVIASELFSYIKKQLLAALDDSAILVPSRVLIEEIDKVQIAIVEVKKCYMENISCIENIVSDMDLLIANQNVEKSTSSLMKTDAKTLGQNCNKQLKTLGLKGDSGTVSQI